MKCIIIDDESASRESIKMMGHWNTFNIDRVFTANDGREGLKMIQTYQPEVIITDMKMDVMDGVSLLKALKDVPYNPCTIVVSGYTDFTYMHSAIDFQVDDYVVKPIGPDKFNEVLQRAIEKYQKRHAQDIVSPEELINRLSNQIQVERIEQNKMLSTPRISRFIDQSNACCLAMLRVLNQQKVCARYFNSIDDLMFFSVQNAIRSFFSGINPMMQFRFDGNKTSFPWLISVEGDLSEEEMETIRNECDRFISLLQDKYEIDGLICISHPCSEIDDLQTALDQIEANIVNHNLFLPYKAMIAQSIHDADDSASYFNRNEKNIADCLGTGRNNDARELIREFFALQDREGFRTIHSLQSGYIDLLRILAKHAGTLSPEQPVWSYYHALNLINTSLSNTQELQEMFVSLISASPDTQNVGSAIPLSKQILQYVTDHYSEDITLEILAKKFYVSREHISRLVKKETRQTFISYLTNCRLDRARYLLKTTDYTLSVVSKICGFHDEGYFIKVFRKKYGITPSQYRK